MLTELQTTPLKPPNVGGPGLTGSQKKSIPKSLNQDLDQETTTRHKSNSNLLRKNFKKLKYLYMIYIKAIYIAISSFYSQSKFSWLDDYRYRVSL